MLLFWMYKLTSDSDFNINSPNADGTHFRLCPWNNNGFHWPYSALLFFGKLSNRYFTIHIFLRHKYKLKYVEAKTRNGKLVDCELIKCGIAPLKNWI